MSDAEAHKPQPEPTSKSRQLSWVSASYFAEGLPWSLIHQVAAEFFTAVGARPSEVGRTALLHIPILLKLVLSPIVEGVSTLRRWMLGTQLLMGVMTGGVAVMAHRVAVTIHPGAADSGWLWGFLFLIGVLSAVYDIACDGFYLEHLDGDDQARYSGVRVAVYRVAMLFGSFLLVFLGGMINWMVSFGLGATLLCGLSLVLSRLLPAPANASRGRGRPDHSRQLPRSDVYLSFLKQRSLWSVLLFLFFYKAADQMMFSMSSVLLSRKLGIGTELRATLGVFSTIASITGAMWGAAWIAKRGLAQALLPITVLMVATAPLYVILAVFAPQLSMPTGLYETVQLDIWLQAFPQLLIVTTILVIEKLCAALAVAAQTIFIMRRCHPLHKTAHYAFATVVYSVAQILLGLSSGYIFENVGPVWYYVIVSILALPALVLARLVPLEQRGLDEI